MNKAKKVEVSTLLRSYTFPNLKGRVLSYKQKLHKLYNTDFLNSDLFEMLLIWANPGLFSVLLTFQFK